MVTRGRPAKAPKITLDLTNVKARRFIREKGTYRFKVISAEQKMGPSNVAYVEFCHEVVEGKAAGAQAWDRLSMDPKALWRWDQFLTAIGYDTGGEISFDLQEFKGLEFYAIIAMDDTYDGTPRAKLVEYLAGEFEEATTPEKAAKAEAIEEEAVDEEETDEEETDEEEAKSEDQLEISEDDVRDMDEAELQELLDELEIKKKLLGSLSMKRKAVIAVLKEAGYL